MTAYRVLIGAPFLSPGDAVDHFLREQGLEPVYAPSPSRRPDDELIRVLRDVDAAIVSADRFPPNVLRAAPRLRAIARVGVGYDAIDLDTATQLGIAVCNMPGVNRDSVAELTMALLLLCARRIPENIDDVRAGSWSRVEGRELRGSTLGIVGYGTIGRAVAALARAFGMTVVAYDKYREPASDQAAWSGVSSVRWEELLRVSDYVTLHIFLDAANRRWLDAEKLALMKPSAYLVNTSRGPVVDERALCDALRAGTIAGAALDVVEYEPLSADSPLRQAPNVYITPHLGGVTREARQRAGMGAAENVARILLGGEPRNVVNPAVLAR